MIHCNSGVRYIEPLLKTGFSGMIANEAANQRKIATLGRS